MSSIDINSLLTEKATTVGRKFAGAKRVFGLTVGLTIVLSVFLATVSGLAINTFNSCEGFGSNYDRVKNIKIFFIFTLVLSIIAFIGACVAIYVYYQFGGPEISAASTL